MDLSLGYFFDIFHNIHRKHFLNDLLYYLVFQLKSKNQYVKIWKKNENFVRG